MRGTVIKGKARGRGLGFPTVNLDCREILVPGEGVYAGGYHTAGMISRERHGAGMPPGEGHGFTGPAAISIGTSPTFGKGNFAVEAHLADWEEDLYGATVTIAFMERLRGQITYSDATALAGQIALDVQKTRDLYNIHELEEIPL